MMADWRKLHGKICENQELGECSLEANLLFERLLIKTDDEGRFYADPTLINKLVFTARKDIKDKQISKWLEELVGKGLMGLYEVDSKKYLYFCNFHKYQQLRKDIKPKIFFPAPSVTGAERSVTDTKQSVDIRGEEIRGEEKREEEIISEEEIKNLRKIFYSPSKDRKKLKQHLLKTRGFTETQAEAIMGEVYND